MGLGKKCLFVCSGASLFFALMVCLFVKQFQGLTAGLYLGSVVGLATILGFFLCFICFATHNKKTIFT